jgi:hypothetical protein
MAWGFGKSVDKEDLTNHGATESEYFKEGVRKLTSLIFFTGMSSSSSYSDSSSELDSSSEELVSVGVEGDFTAPVSSARRLANLSCTNFGPLLVPLYLLRESFVSFGALIFLVDARAGVDVPKRGVSVAKQQTRINAKIEKENKITTYETYPVQEQALYHFLISVDDISEGYLASCQ